MTVKEIAKLANVSPATVSNVLNHRNNVGKETRQRILEICKENGYDINKGKNKKPAEDTNTILFNFSDYERNFYLKIIHGISDYVYSRGYDLMICTNKSCEKFMDPALTCGTIMLDMKCKNSTLIQKANEGYPIVALDRIMDVPNIKSVVVNNYAPMAELVDKGYRRFGYIAGIDTLDNQERYRALKDVLQKNGITFSRENYFLGDYYEKSGYQSARLMLLSDNIPEVLVCANDNMAIGAMKALRQEGLKIPDYERGYLAAQFLLQNIAGSCSFDTFKIAAKVHWRKTTR